MAGNKQKILVVDDHRLNLKLLCSLLKADYEIAQAGNGEQAIQIASTDVPPDLILLDIQMEGMDGYEVCRRLRAEEKTRDIPIIFITGMNEIENEAKGLEQGAVDYITKPIHASIVKARVKTHLKLKSTREELEKKNAFIRRTFGRYLSDDVVDTILDAPQGLSLGGRKCTATIMMTDLRGFTSTAERLSAESVVKMLNIYFEVMTDIIFKYQGTIDEFIGDAILAIFGAPVQRQNDAQRAAACALEMQLAMEEVNRRNREAGYPEITMGIGINTGELVVGNIGSRKRTKYAVVGRNVNMTSRIESYTVGGQIFISESTLAACGSILRIEDQMEIMPKGIAKPITISELTGINGEFNIRLPQKNELELQTLPQMLPVKFNLLEGKHTGPELHEGQIVKLSMRVAEIQGSVELTKLDNLKIVLFDNAGNDITDELYGKVTETSPESPTLFRVTFTSIPPQVGRFFEKIIS
ncbi:MAG: response regulator [Gammaproteobacteria bacterium]|nr:response regulator [Gammaproteobacteria bacterium]